MDIPFLQVASKQDHAPRTKSGQAEDARGLDKTGAGEFQNAYEAQEDKKAGSEEVMASPEVERPESEDATKGKGAQSASSEETDSAKAKDAKPAEADDTVARTDAEEADIPVGKSMPDAQEPKKTAKQADMAEMVLQHRFKTHEQTSSGKNAAPASREQVLQSSAQGATTQGALPHSKVIVPEMARESTKAVVIEADMQNPKSATNTRSAETVTPPDTKSMPAALGSMALHGQERSPGLRKAARDEASLRATHSEARSVHPVEGQDILQQGAPKTGTNTAQPALSTVQGAASGSLEQAKLQTADAQFVDIQPIEGGDVDFASFKDMRTTAPASLAQVLSRPETPGQIARQMAEAAQRMQDQSVQIALSPKELGKVKMMISALEGAVTVNVVAERPETLDLMRRNMHELVREFQALGYDTVNFSFAEGQSGANAGKNDREDGPRHFSGTAETADMQPAEDASIIQLIPSDGLDLRL
jgi:flagellar hook-length control protein FliK